MAYTTINKSTDHFNTKIYTGTGTTTTFTGVGFQPDWCWFKARNFADPHQLYDSVRGVHKYVRSNENSAEGDDSGSLQAFTSDGFTLGNSGNVNGGTSQNLVAWNWKAGTTTIPTGGSLDATAVSINTTSGFGIYKYTGDGAGVRSIAHGLGSIPKMMIIKRLNSTRDWSVYHASLPLAEHLELNNSDAAATANLWWSSRPTSSLIYFNGDGQVNGGSDPYIMYAFAEKQGYSKFGSYTGNGNADGTFVYTGFKPAFVMIKPYTHAIGWSMIDNKRDSENNGTTSMLKANSTSTEDDNAAYNIEFLSNGFKNRNTNSSLNNPGYGHIYMAFAEAPLVGTNNVPATAR